MNFIWFHNADVISSRSEDAQFNELSALRLKRGFSKAMRSGTVLQLHWRQSIFLQKKDLRVGFSILGLCNVQVRSLALPSIVKKQMSGKWSWISHCHQDIVFRMFWDVFGCLKSSQAPFCCGWPSTCTWWKFRRVFFQNCQSQSFSALMLVHAGEYCDIAKSDAIGCPLIKAMAWFFFASVDPCWPIYERRPFFFHHQCLLWHVLGVWTVFCLWSLW